MAALATVLTAVAASGAGPDGPGLTETAVPRASRLRGYLDRR
ncbi:hypothetical protein [Streptomyces aidingensis]|nr:hypothetical protein [Streptomyces aidingensis]